MSAIQRRRHVFISCSRHDRPWLERLEAQLAPYLRGETLQVRDDAGIAPGSDWRGDVQDELDRVRVAVLLASPAFLASPLADADGLPELLAHAPDDLVAFWIPIEPLAGDTAPLQHLEPLHDPATPLAGLTADEQGRALADIARHIAAAMDLNAIGNAMRLIDAFAPQMEAYLDGRPEPAEPPEDAAHTEQAALELLVIHDGDERKLIGVKDLLQLDPSAPSRVRDHEGTMATLFDRWNALQPGRAAGDEALRGRALAESEEVRRELCGEATAVLSFVDTLGLSLQDHYRHVRFVCRPRP